MTAYEIAKGKYAKYGIDTDAAIKLDSQIRRFRSPFIAGRATT